MSQPTSSRRFSERLREVGRRLERTVRRRLVPYVRNQVHRLRGAERGPPTEAAALPIESSPVPRDRGTILIVSHDAEVGGAQKVARVFAAWLLRATRYDVKFVVMRGGGLLGSFERIAPVFDASGWPPGKVAEQLREFAGEDVRAILVNSVASGGFLRLWTQPTPVVAFIHELRKLLGQYAAEVDLIKRRATLIVAGSAAVATVLRDEHGCDERRLHVLPGFIEDASVDDGVPSVDKTEAKRALGIDPDTLLVTACGVAHWRKSPHTFVEVAQRVVARAGRPVRFLWVGHGPDRADCEALARRLGIDSRVTFTGYQADIEPFLRASDVFLLPSEEDPFPLVCLYAGVALNPVICFADAGGMPEVVARGGGRVVPFGDVAAMADAVLAYLDDDAARLSDARGMRDAVLSRHTVAAAGPCLLHWIREAAGLRPHVSVVVPNFNYARFLPERLESLRRQTYQDFEVLLLDDASTDGSLPLLERWASARDGSRVVANGTNGGSPFPQWLKGLDMARGDLVWIAEADDTCAPELLASLVPSFDDRNVFLAYAKSVPIDSHGAVLGDYERLYLDRIAAGRWSRDYVATDHEEANAGLGIANCIPNASSVVFRRFRPEPEFATALTGMRLCGDWLFYLRAMRGGFVSYHSAPLNMHRRHEATVTHGTEGTDRYFAEFAEVRRFVADTYRLAPDAERRIATFTAEDVNRFGGRVACPRLRLEPAAAPLPSVLYVASDLSPGGGQMFIIRLANAWVERGGRAAIYNAGAFPDHPRVVAKIHSQVAVFSRSLTSVGDVVSRFGIDLVHSAIWWADDCVLAAIDRMSPLPWVITMHGCHETLLDHPETDPAFPRKVAAMLARADVWVHTADKNERLFAVYGSPAGAVRIENGVEVEAGEALTREQVGLSASALVACLASRAIADKGWAEAVAAVRRLRAAGRDVELLLIGEGPAADAVRAAGPEGVRLVGQVSNLQGYLAVADVVLLPSSFVGESLPLVLLEAMALGKPLIATAVGEIPALVGSAPDAAGLLLPLVNGRPDVAGLAAAIEALADPAARRAMGRAARARFERQYRLDAMVDRYESLYRDCLAARPQALPRAA